MARSKRVGPFTQTVGALNSQPKDAFLPDYGKQPGARQHLDSVIKRREMGQKLTPMGRTTLRKSR